jgi:hypothetical protein
MIIYHKPAIPVLTREKQFVTCFCSYSSQPNMQPLLLQPVTENAVESGETLVSL